MLVLIHKGRTHHLLFVRRSVATPQLRADLHTSGDHVLHLDSGAVLLEDITYSHIFYFGKPLLPFGRYRSETFEGEQVYAEPTLAW